MRMESLSKTTKALTWLITGCSSGFGLQLARHALAAGHHVIATSRTPSKTPELVQEVESRNRLKLILPWLETRIQQGSQDAVRSLPLHAEELFLTPMSKYRSEEPHERDSPLRCFVQSAA